MVKLHIGCGVRNFGPDWIHIDGEKLDHVVYNDITRLNFETHSVDLIYASHVLQYFDRTEVKDVLHEWHRVLKPGAILRIAVPNFKILSNMYFGGYLNLNQLLGPMYGRWSMNGKIIYHKTTYDFDSLKTLLDDIGFKDITKYEWRNTNHSQFDDHSQAYIPHMDKENGTLISLNVEATKLWL
jgi:predicted SAM-dependent methyltransferase